MEVSNDDVCNANSDVDSDDSLILPTQPPSTSADNESLKRRQKVARYQRHKNDSKCELEDPSSAKFIERQALDPISPEVEAGNCDIKVRARLMPKPNMSQILRDEGLPREYTGLKLEYARTQAILSGNGSARKRKRRSRSSQNFSQVDSELMEGSLDAARLFSSDDFGPASQSGTCELVPSSQGSQLSGTAKRIRDSLVKRFSVGNSTPNESFPKLLEVNISREVSGESVEASSVSPVTSKELPRNELTQREHTQVSNLKSSQYRPVSHESPVKQGELLFSSQSPIINRSLRRKLKRKKSLEKKRKKLSNEFSSKDLKVQVKNPETVEKIETMHLDSSVMILSQSETLSLGRTEDDAKENENLSQSLLKKFSPSPVLPTKLSEQKFVEKLAKDKNKEQFSDLKLSPYQSHDCNLLGNFAGFQEESLPEKMVSLINDENLDGLNEIAKDSIDDEQTSADDEQLQSPHLHVSRSNDEQGLEVEPSVDEKTSPISPIILAETIQELEWSQTHNSQTSELGVSIDSKEIQIVSEIFQPNVVEPGASEINTEHRNVLRSNTEEDLKDISLSWFNDDMNSEAGDDKPVTSHEFVHPNDVRSSPKDIRKVPEEKDETLFPDSLGFLNYNTMDLMLEDDMRKEAENRIIDLSPYLNGRIEVRRVLISEHQVTA